MQTGLFLDPKTTERILAEQFGNRWSFDAKAKLLSKFGRTINADSDTRTTVAEFQGTTINETFATANTIDSIVSSSTSDVGEVTIEGHWIDGAGHLIFSVQKATLNGRNRVALTQTLCRATRIFRSGLGTIASPTTDLVGTVAVYDNTASGGLSNGVPVTAAATKVLITAGQQQSKKCATSVSYDDAWVILQVTAGIERTTGGASLVEIEIEYREIGGVWRPATGAALTLSTAALPLSTITFATPAVIPPNSDVRMVANASANDTVVHGTISGPLAIRIRQ